MRSLCPSLQELIISSTVYGPDECQICVPVSDNRPRFLTYGSRPPLSDDFMRTAGDTLERLAINCDYLLDDHLLRALFSPGPRHLYIENSRYYLDSTFVALLMHEHVACSIGPDRNNQWFPFNLSRPASQNPAQNYIYIISYFYIP